MGNLFYDPEQAARGTAKENSDLVELLMAESLIREELVELSLRNGKSYIGFALDSGIDRPQGEPDVSLIPMASGYRDKYTQELETTPITSDGSIGRTVIPLSIEVIHISES